MKIAVIGSGVSGLAATWLLNEHSDHEVHLFEADDRAGGHANTVCCQFGDEEVYVDTGFVVFNATTYPNFLRFLSFYPDIVILPTSMTFSVARDDGFVEWAGNSLAGVFCQPSRLLDPAMWRLLYDILRFNACARDLIVDSNYLENCSVADYLAREKYSDTFRDDYLIPMVAAIWNTPPESCLLEFPVQTLVKFMSNHHLLQITGKSDWLTIKGGSEQYVHAILKRLPESQLHLSTPITSVENTPDGDVQVTTADGRALNFDRVIMACHSDTTLTLLKAGSGMSEREEEILGQFVWNRNEVVLHSDISLMPKSRFAWAAWSYLTSSSFGEDRGYKANTNNVSVTYSMNILQHLPESKYGPILVTLSPPAEPAGGTVAARFHYAHPVLNTDALAAMKRMHLIQNHRGILYAGAWLGYGFHEDGFTSGLRVVANDIEDVRLPFEIASVDLPIQPVLAARVFDLLEWRGARHVLGKILSFVLALVGRFVFVHGVGHGRG